ncbi:MAG: type III glutamate--ammonia ligase, partial [Hyphomicrobiaceae bacterium]
KAPDAKKLPLNMLDSIRGFEASDTMRATLGDEFCTAFVKLKMDEWNSYMRHLSDWERANTLDI